MSNPTWPDPAALSRMFGAASKTSTPAFAQGLAGGMDLARKFWSNLPGGTALPGFLVPTVDVEELDKLLADLRAAESWVEVNLGMLRATIQGLEVQRNTIAAIQSLSTMAESPLAGWPATHPSPPVAPPAGSASTGLPAGWPTSPASPPSDDAQPAAATTGTPDAVDPDVGVATSNWLGFMQEQFMKVAQAALAPAATDDVASQKPAQGRAAGKRAPRKAAGPRPDARAADESSAKARARRKPAAR